ncbi:hypothetical protein C8J57DRAFT_1227690 [Mycena rebaudengoi]|nr:hypothetical protein C8J57DRAFT_1227690 [Mycena rebaudengoi]
MREGGGRRRSQRTTRIAAQHAEGHRRVPQKSVECNDEIKKIEKGKDGEQRRKRTIQRTRYYRAPGEERLGRYEEGMEGKRYPRGRNKKRVGERRDITRILAKWDGKTVNAEAERGRSGDDVEGRKNDEGEVATHALDSRAVRRLSAWVSSVHSVVGVRRVELRAVRIVNGGRHYEPRVAHAPRAPQKTCAGELLYWPGHSEFQRLLYAQLLREKTPSTTEPPPASRTLIRTRPTLDKTSSPEAVRADARASGGLSRRPSERRRPRQALGWRASSWEPRSCHLRRTRCAWECGEKWRGAIRVSERRARLRGQHRNARARRFPQGSSACNDGGCDYTPTHYVRRVVQRESIEFGLERTGKCPKTGGSAETRMRRNSWREDSDVFALLAGRRAPLGARRAAA